MNPPTKLIYVFTPMSGGESDVRFGMLILSPFACHALLRCTDAVRILPEIIAEDSTHDTGYATLFYRGLFVIGFLKDIPNYLIEEHADRDFCDEPQVLHDLDADKFEEVTSRDNLWVRSESTGIRVAKDDLRISGYPKHWNTLIDGSNFWSEEFMELLKASAEEYIKELNEIALNA